MLLVRSIGDNSPQTPPTLEDDVMELDAGAGNGEDDDEDGDEVKALSKDNILGMPPTPPAVVDEKMPQRVPFSSATATDDRLMESDRNAGKVNGGDDGLAIMTDYQRALVKEESKWVLRLVGEEDPSKKPLLGCGDCKEKFPQHSKKGPLSYIRQSLDECGAAQRKVPFTFCCMKQNIFDVKIRRRKGGAGKPARSKRSHSIAAIDCSTHPAQGQGLPNARFAGEACESSKGSSDGDNETTCEKPDVTGFKDSVREQTTFKREVLLEEDEEVAVAVASSPPSQTTSEAPKSEEPDEPMLPKTSGQRSPHSFVSGEVLDLDLGPKLHHLRDCSITVLDVFGETPLFQFSCSGCSKRYCGAADDVTVNLADQTLLLTCSRCLWWTRRAISSHSRKLKPI